MEKKTQYSIVLVLIFCAIFVAGLVLYVSQKQSEITGSGSKTGQPCTAEARQCPDGSYVGKTGPNCEFTPCPGDGPSKIIWRSEPQGDFVADERDPSTVCDSIKDKENLQNCELIKAKTSDSATECADGRSVAGCFACQFKCSDNKLSTDPNIQPSPIGGQKDEHGCLSPAGFSWCEIKQRCIRSWEEDCDAPDDETKNWFIESGSGFSYRRPNTCQVNESTGINGGGPLKYIFTCAENSQIPGEIIAYKNVDQNFIDQKINNPDIERISNFIMHGNIRVIQSKYPLSGRPDEIMASYISKEGYGTFLEVFGPSVSDSTQKIDYYQKFIKTFTVSE